MKITDVILVLAVGYAVYCLVYNRVIDYFIARKFYEG